MNGLNGILVAGFHSMKLFQTLNEKSHIQCKLGNVVIHTVYIHTPSLFT